MRNPEEIISTTGWSGLLSIQFFLAGNVFSALINPTLWVVFIMLHFFDAAIFKITIPIQLQWLNLTALFVGNSCFIAFSAIAPLKRGWTHLCIFGLTAPVYWLLTSLAAYKALWQIIFRPHYWEKTDHVISEMAIRRREAILQGFAN